MHKRIVRREVPDTAGVRYDVSNQEITNFVAAPVYPDESSDANCTAANSQGSTMLSGGRMTYALENFANYNGRDLDNFQIIDYDYADTPGLYLESLTTGKYQNPSGAETYSIYITRTPGLTPSTIGTATWEKLGDYRFDTSSSVDLKALQGLPNYPGQIGRAHV